MSDSIPGPLMPRVVRRWRGIRPLLAFMTLLVAVPLAHGHGAYHDRLADIDLALAKDAGNASLWLQRVELHLGHEEWTKAINDLQKVEALAPGKYPVGWYSARALAGAGKLVDAKLALNTFLSANPDHAGALATRARVHADLGEKDAALNDYRNALLHDKQPSIELTTDAAAIMCDRGHPEEAADLLDQVVARFPSDTATLKASQEADVAAKRFDAALIRIETLRTTAPRPEPWMARRAEVLALAGRADESRAEWLALKNHLSKLPNLERGNPLIREIEAAADRPLQAATPDPASAPATKPDS